MKKLPQGIWKDTETGETLQVVYYDSRSKCYRVEYVDMAEMRRWVPVEDFGPDKRFQSMGTWGRLLQQKLDLRAGRPVMSASDFSLA
jgi:hypothetical protein